MQLHEISEHNTKIWVSEHIQADFKGDWFDCAHSSESVMSGNWKSGRQEISHLTVGDLSLVLRHYYRGGLPARLSKDQFIFHGFVHSRPFKEIRLLQYMQQLGLPVPEPIAARCKVNGILYNADILMSEITDSKTLMQTISENALEQDMWVRVGEVIAKFHQQGIQHVDLNANNILLDKAGSVYLIDFDRCKQRTFSQSWANAGLARLKRSLDKQKLVNKDINFEQRNFDSLIRGYQT
ncbi:MAG: 3-deoxy-D-manno-octulosonic acid kinase [Gammaproteobacteria bacterium]|nr:3-deoxy-D-manno-octulosonic acid kinase [Gammaproteobacteria bacterium]